MVVRHLPRGVALVRIEIPFGRVLWTSDRLTEREEVVARVIASLRVRAGARAVILRETEVALAVDAA